MYSHTRPGAPAPVLPPPLQIFGPSSPAQQFPQGMSSPLSQTILRRIREAPSWQDLRNVVSVHVRDYLPEHLLETVARLQGLAEVLEAGTEEEVQGLQVGGGGMHACAH